MKINKKTLYIAIAFVCILVASIFVTVKNKDSASLVSVDNESSCPSSEVRSSTTELTTKFSFKEEETEEANEDFSTEEKVIEIYKTTTRTTRKDTSVNGKPSETPKVTITTKVTTTTKNTTPTKPSYTKPSKVQSTTEYTTEITTKKILYYYTDSTTGYTPKPGAEYYSNGYWNIVSWGNTVTDEEIKEAHKNDSTDPWY